jgi:hypothetical protein
VSNASGFIEALDLCNAAVDARRFEHLILCDGRSVFLEDYERTYEDLAMNSIWEEYDSQLALARSVRQGRSKMLRPFP